MIKIVRAWALCLSCSKTKKNTQDNQTIFSLLFERQPVSVVLCSNRNDFT